MKRQDTALKNQFCDGISSIYLFPEFREQLKQLRGQVSYYDSQLSENPYQQL